MLSRLRTSLAYRSWAVRKTPPPWSLEGHLRQLLSEHDVSLAFDVGAHFGEFAHRLRHVVGFGGAIVSFEPDPTALAEAQRTMHGDHDWSPVNLALGRDRGRRTLNVYSLSLYSSLRPLRSEARTEHGQTLIDKRDVDVACLDDVAPQYMGQHGPGSQKALLKVDTQGFDAEVLAGGRRTIEERVAILQVEVPMGTPIYTDAPSIGEMIDLVVELGFGVTWIGPCALRDDGSIVECDLVAVRRS